ncbi:MAG: hypothetical protein H6822_32480 [Planctomycetaceae bacterium]|nr:hypothetical protein [Planctomycetales bacterium]MCB9926903.1 hypothetical protein [Planctomycetaceae bacterium]
MSDQIDRMAIYLHLARASEMRRRLHARDRFLILAAVLAARSDLPRIAAYCRQRIIEHNPRHLIGRWESVWHAAGDPEFVHFLRHIERRYPHETAERMLGTLGLELGREREAYYDDEEYAASLLGVTQAELNDQFGEA